MNKKKYSKEEIEKIIDRDVHYWRWDKTEGVYMNCWSIQNSRQWGYGSKPAFVSREEAKAAFRGFLYKHYLTN